MELLHSGFFTKDRFSYVSRLSSYKSNESLARDRADRLERQVLLLIGSFQRAFLWSAPLCTDCIHQEDDDGVSSSGITPRSSAAG